MTKINKILEYVIIEPLNVVGIIIIVTLFFMVTLKKRYAKIILAVLLIVTATIFTIIYVCYNNAVMPKELETAQIEILEKILVDDYIEVVGVEVNDVGGVELSVLVVLDKEIDIDLSKEILLEIRDMLIGREFSEDIKDYYWSEYYNQHSFEVKYVGDEILYTYYASRGSNSINMALNKWEGYNHLIEEKFEFILE